VLPSKALPARTSGQSSSATYSALLCSPTRARVTESDPCARVFGDLVASIGFKLHQRLWSGFSLESEGPVCVAHGGEGVGFERDVAGRGRALARAVATGGCVTFDAPDERLSLHAQACSGFVVPLRVEDRACGFLCFESSRRRDFKAKDVEACTRAAEQAGLALRVAQMCAWHADRFRFEPWFDVAREDFRAFASHLLVAARSRSTVVLTGPSGVGKLVLARWIHFESADPAAAFKVHTCGSESGDVQAALRACLQSACGGTLVLDDVDQLSPAWQEELLRALEGVERAGDAALERNLPARIVATTRVDPLAAKDAGRLRADLAARLDRLTLIVPALRERREEIPALVTAMAARFAEEEDRALPRFDDETIALLWRQPWNENLRGLENVVYKLVLLHGGEEVRTEHVAALRRRFGLELVRKLPSRHPDRRDIVAALRSTRLAGGRVNKTRAAIYLGWDPDTLVARMASEGVEEEQLAALDAWNAGAPHAESDSDA
jgi:transcriptional regulator with GAF, ATPase, and Fis domain